MESTDSVTVGDSTDKYSERGWESLNEPAKKEKPCRRKDVLYKGLLWQCRKHYQQKFLTETKHVKYQKCKEKRHSSLKANLKKFCGTEFRQQTGTGYESWFFLGSFIYPNEIKRILEAELESATSAKQKEIRGMRWTVEKIHCTLYKYSHSKLQGMLKIPEVYLIFKGFLTHLETSRSCDLSSILPLKEMLANFNKFLYAVHPNMKGRVERGDYLSNRSLFAIWRLPVTLLGWWQKQVWIMTREDLGQDIRTMSMEVKR